jgi:hypothetical protein
MPIPAGGVPRFLSVFGRDSPVASLQYQIIDPKISCGALERLAELQADQIDDYRDAQPGKIRMSSDTATSLFQTNPADALLRHVLTQKLSRFVEQVTALISTSYQRSLM